MPSDETPTSPPKPSAGSSHSGTNSAKQPNPKPRGIFNRFLSFVEWMGNLLPHPVTLFALFTLGVILISAIAAFFNVQVEDPRPGKPDIKAVSILSGDGFRWLTTNFVTNFSEFPPLGTVLVALLGVGIAEKSGLLGAAIRLMVLGAPKQLVTLVVVFAGILSNTASEMGYVVLIPLAMVIYHALGRHPLAGMAAAFAGVSGGYSANLLIGTIDPLLAGITQEAAQVIDPSYTVNPTANWYFMIVSTFMISALGWFISERIVEPRLGTYDPAEGDGTIDPSPKVERVSAAERRGLAWAGVATLLVTAALVMSILPPIPSLTGIPLWGVMRNPDVDAAIAAGDTSLTTIDAVRPFLGSIVAFIFVFFIIPGVVYGKVVGTIKNDRDAIDAMADAMRSMGLYIVLVFFAAQFIACFRYSNLGQIISVVGADALIAAGLDNMWVFIPFIGMCAIVNLSLGSASAQWALTAPVFVPMLMRLGYSPEVIQCAYRIGDSTTNIITPMMSYFGLILAMVARYQKNIGIGTMVATMLPYSIAFIIGWTILFYIWVFAFDLPVGPGSPTYYPADATEAAAAVQAAVSR